MRANKLKEIVDPKKLTIGDALLLKHILGLTNSEAVTIFLGGSNRENIQV